MFKEIDIQKWTRKEHYNHFTKEVPCTYNICSKIDITKLVKSKIQLTPRIIYLISKLVNSHEEFRIAHNKKGIVGIYDKLNPIYAYFNKETETFTNIWTEYKENYEDFLKGYIEDTYRYKDSKKLIAKADTPENVFNISIIPWRNFEGFNLNIKKGYEYLLPIFTIGKYEKSGNNTYLPISIQVHHAVCDGFHVSRFINELEELLNESKIKDT